MTPSDYSVPMVDGGVYVRYVSERTVAVSVKLRSDVESLDIGLDPKDGDSVHIAVPDPSRTWEVRLKLATDHDRVAYYAALLLPPKSVPGTDEAPDDAAVSGSAELVDADAGIELWTQQVNGATWRLLRYVPEQLRGAYAAPSFTVVLDAANGCAYARWGPDLTAVVWPHGTTVGPLGESLIFADGFAVANRERLSGGGGDSHSLPGSYYDTCNAGGTDALGIWSASPPDPQP